MGVLPVSTLPPNLLVSPSPISPSHIRRRREMSRRSKRAQSKAWLSSISPVSKIKSRPPDTPAVHHRNQPVISDTMVAPHSSQQTAPDTAGTSHSNQLIILDTLAAPQQVVLETHTSSVTNVGTAPFANASNIVLNNPTFNDIQVPPDQVASGKPPKVNRFIPLN